MTRRERFRGLRSAVVGRATGNREVDGERSFREIEVVNSPKTKTESLERTLDRAESVLEGQLADLAVIHERAIRTVRIEAVLLGALGSVAQLTPSGLPANSWVTVSSLLLVASIIAGIFTSGSTSPNYGPGPGYVKSNFESGDTNEDVYLELLQGYREAISYNSGVVNDSATHLFVTQALFVAAIVSGSIAIFV